MTNHSANFIQTNEGTKGKTPVFEVKIPGGTSTYDIRFIFV